MKPTQAHFSTDNGRILYGKRVRLRPLEIEDAKRILRWGKNPSDLLSGYNYGQMTQIEAKLWQRSKRSLRVRYFAIDIEDRELIGYLGAKNINRVKRSAQLGIVLDPNYQSQGYGQDALERFLDYFFNEWSMDRISLEVNYFNKRALHIYQKLGFTIYESSLEPFENPHIDFNKKENAPFKDAFVYKNHTLYAKIWKMEKERP